MHKSFSYFAVTALVAATLVACGGGSDGPGTSATGDTAVITASGRVATFNRATPGTLVSDLGISGLNGSEQLIGIDVRPANGLLYAVTNAGRIYTIDPATGVATFRVALANDAANTTAFTALAGTSFGVDFNPVPDRLRVVSNTGQNLRINVDTGATLVDGAINGVAGASVTASAYTNSFAGAATTQLFNLDCATGQRYLQNPPNNGTLGAGTALGVACDAANGFDIDAKTNTGFAALRVGGVTRLYNVSLATGGGATAVGTIGNGDAVLGLALLNQAAAPTVYVLSGNSLSRINPAAPNTLTGTTAITGLNAGENVLGIDFRPANGLLYALTSSARLLTVNPDTGAGTAVATLAADPADLTAPFTALAGTNYTVDFNPAADRLRVISDTGQSLRINVVTGATTTDGNINRTVPAVVVAGAYASNFAGTTTTTLYDLDSASDVLAIQNPPNDGTLADVGALGVDLTGQNAFDIAGGDNGLALAALRVGLTGPFSLYNINLATGAATLRGTAAAAQIGGAAGPVINDIAIRY
jgi:hypothetical protein